MSKSPPYRPPWQLTTADFYGERVYAKKTRRYEIFFEYLRVSPSYAMAMKASNQSELAKRIGDDDRAARLWRTREDVGDVFSVMFKTWWKTRGLDLFGVHSKKPEPEAVAVLDAIETARTSRGAMEALYGFIKGSYREQGHPDSVLISIPLGQTRLQTNRQIGKILADIEAEHPPHLPAPKYELVQNKIQDDRMMLGLELLFIRAAFPSVEIWRAAAKAKISATYAHIDPAAQKKDAKSGEARRNLTIMALRLQKETLTIAENAALGIFPSTSPIEILPFDLASLGYRLTDLQTWEKGEKARMLRELAQAQADIEQKR